MKKVVVGTDVDDIGNLENLSMKNLGILTQSLMVDNLLEILTKKRREVFCKPIDFHSLANAVSEGISSISQKNIVNQLDKHDFLNRQYII